MTPDQRAKLIEFFEGALLKSGDILVPGIKETVDEFLVRAQRFGDWKAATRAGQARAQIDKKIFFPDQITGQVAGGAADPVQQVAADYIRASLLPDVAQYPLSYEATEEAAKLAAAKSLGIDPNIDRLWRRQVQQKFDIDLVPGRGYVFKLKATATGPYTIDIVGTGETRTLILSQDGKRVASSHLGAALTDYTADELKIVSQAIPDSTEKFVLVQARGKTIAQWRESTLDENKMGETSFQAAWAKGETEGIPEDRRDVKTSIAPDGTTRYFPAIKPAGAAEADIGTAETAETTTIKLGEGQGSLLIYKTGNQVGSIRIPPKPGVTLQNTFKTPGGGVRAVFSDGSEQIYGEEDFTLGTPIQRTGPGGQMNWYIEHAPGQYSQIPETFKPDVVRLGDREFTQDVSGRLTPLAREFDPGITQIGDRTIMQQPSGQISELQRQFDPGVVTDPSGLQLLQQPSGAVSQTRAANINEIIAQALIDGNFDKALAFQDFANRPSAKEAFDAALSFARSPADQQLVSSIARGETPVAPPPPGVVQRIGPQPDFLVQAYNEFQQRLRGGRPPTAEEQEQYSARYRAGETPITDELKLKYKTQEDANQRAVEKNQQAMASLEQRRDTDKRNFDLQIQKQQQDFDLKIAQATGQFQKVGQPLSATNDAPPDDTPPGETPTTANEPVPDGMERYFNEETGKWYLREVKETPGKKVLTRQEQLAKNLADVETGFRQQYRALNRELSQGAAGIGPYAGLVTADELQQWVLTAARNAGASSSSYWEIMFETYSGLARRKWEKSDEAAREKDAIALAADEAAREKDAIALATDEAGIGDTDEIVQDIGVEGGRLEGEPMEVLGEDDEASYIARASSAAAPAPEISDERIQAPSQPSWLESDLMDVLGDQGTFGQEMEVLGEYDTDFRAGMTRGNIDFLARGGMTRGKNFEIVGEKGPELVDLPPGTFVLPIKGLNQRQVRQAKRRGVPGYQAGGVVFQQLPFGLRQQQAGRAITPPRGYLSQAAGLTLPSAQAFQNITPESREVFFDVAKQAGIPQGAFAQELRTAFPGGKRLPVSRNYPLRFRGVR